MVYAPNIMNRWTNAQTNDHKFAKGHGMKALLGKHATQADQDQNLERIEIHIVKNREQKKEPADQQSCNAHLCTDFLL